MIDELQASPVPEVHCRALEEVLQEGAAIARGVAGDAVEFATRVLAACVARYDNDREAVGREMVPVAVSPATDIKPDNVALVPEIGPVKVAPVSFE